MHPTRTTFQVIEDQLGLYRRHAQVAESWKVAHEEAMECREIEDVIRFGLGILESIRHRSEQWAREVQKGTRAFAWEDSEGIGRLYRGWLERSRAVLAAIVDCEARGFPVEGADEFRTRCREVALMPLDIDRVRESLASLEGSRGIAAGQALDALRNRLRRESS